VQDYSFHVVCCHSQLQSPAVATKQAADMVSSLRAATAVTQHSRTKQHPLATEQLQMRFTLTV
jgi:hypothetical protein